MIPLRSYIICCTPRSGSHLFSDGLASTGAAGYPAERFPRQPAGTEATAALADAMVTEAPPESWYDSELDREYIKSIFETGTLLSRQATLEDIDPEDDEPISPEEAATRWRDYAPNIEVIQASGNHMTMLREPHIEAVARAVQRAWARYQ